jgi:hypothetical protein
MPNPTLREKAEQARRLARYATDPTLQVSLRKFADECIMRADELEAELIAKDQNSYAHA